MEIVQFVGWLKQAWRPEFDPQNPDLNKENKAPCNPRAGEIEAGRSWTLTSFVNYGVVRDLLSNTEVDSA